MSQAIGSGRGLATLVVAFVLMYAVNATGTLRVSREGELEGLDLHEHGMVAYPEYVIHGYEPTPSFMTPVSAPSPKAHQTSPART
jgi:Amt family ammonium transporter